MKVVIPLSDCCCWPCALRKASFAIQEAVEAAMTKWNCSRKDIGVHLTHHEMLGKLVYTVFHDPLPRK